MKVKVSEPPIKFPRRIYLSVPHIGGTEKNYVQEAFEQNWLSTVGPNLTELEKRFSRIMDSHSVALSSGTAGIHLGLRLLGVKPRDEVVVPTLTFIAGCNPVLYEHAKPVLVDSELSTWNLDPQRLSDFLLVRARNNRMPKVVTVAHIFGQPADLDVIVELCQRYELPLLEDAAESLGSRYKNRHPGTFGDVGVFSFNGNKIITSTSGGMLVAQDIALVERARKWSAQSREEDPQDINDYVHNELGYNYRMSNVLAGIAIGQLEMLEKRVEQRRAVFDRYRTAFGDLPGITPQPETKFGRHTRWLSCFLIDERKSGVSAPDLIHYLGAANVEARPVWKPMHTQPLYRRCERIGGGVAEDLNKRGICLPSSSSLTEEEQNFVISRVLEVFRSTLNN